MKCVKCGDSMTRRYSSILNCPYWECSKCKRTERMSAQDTEDDYGDEDGRV